jgi:nucleotide-binding universal stress UspA family protein
MYKRILVAYDGSEAGQKALLESKELAQWANSELHLVAVMPPASALIGGEGYVYDPRIEEEERKEYESILQEGLKRLSESGRSVGGEIMVGDAVDEIARYARKIDADLIVLGHKHLTSWTARWWRGSVSKALIEHAPCSVLVVITR